MLAMTSKTDSQQQLTKPSQAKTQKIQALPIAKRDLTEAFFAGKYRRCGSINHTVKDCKVAANVDCRRCKKFRHLAKICAGHIFGNTPAQKKTSQTKTKG